MTSLRLWRSRLVLLLAAGVILGTGGYTPTVWAGGTVTVCDYATFSAVLAAPGDTVTFGCSGTITVPEITINKNTIINATGQNVILSGNNANGVFYVNSGIELTLIKLTVSGGVAAFGGGIYNQQGTVTLINSTLSGNRAQFDGGGIFNNQGTVTLTNSTLSGNSAVFSSGGIMNSGTVTLTNSTLSGNSATTNGGGIFNQGTVTLINSTLSGNSAKYGGGIFNNMYGTVTLTNSLIANSPSGSNCFGTGTLTATGNNLADDTSCDAIPGNLTGLDPTLAYNGGPTQTHALLPGSNAIDACDCVVATDQRGVTRPQGSTCDIGAYERRWSSSGGSGVPGISGLGLGALLLLLPGIALAWRRL